MNMVRFAEFLGSLPPNEEKLAAFLEANGEWVRLEFKEARQVPVYGLRKSIAALASTSGGDLFLGVLDDGTLRGCSFDRSALSAALMQTGAPDRADLRTNLVEVVGDPISISLSNGNTVFWLVVPECGWIVAALHEDGSLGLYDRPGANSSQVVGLDAVDFFRRPNRARILREIFEEASGIEGIFNWVYQGPGFVNDETIQRLQRLVHSPEWDRFVRKDERRWVQSDEYLGLFLRLPGLYARWEGMYPASQQREMLEVKNHMGDALRRMRVYLEQERILPPAPP